MLMKCTPIAPGLYSMAPCSIPPAGKSTQPMVDRYPSRTAAMGSLYFSSAAFTALIAAELSAALPCCFACAPSVLNPASDEVSAKAAATAQRNWERDDWVRIGTHPVEGER